MLKMTSQRAQEIRKRQIESLIRQQQEIEEREKAKLKQINIEKNITINPIPPKQPQTLENLFSQNSSQQQQQPNIFQPFNAINQNMNDNVNSNFTCCL